MPDTTRLSTLTARIGGGFGLLLVLGLLLAAPASAALEQVGTFAESGEANQLTNASGIAVNATGAGGVPTGTVYAVSSSGSLQFNHVARYSPTGEFREAWGWNVSATGGIGFQRCGPDGDPAHPVCNTNGDAGEGVGQLYSPLGVAVDQSTGHVYVLNAGQQAATTAGAFREHNLVQVFSPDGSQLIDAFGDLAPPGETFDQSPEKLHSINNWSSGIAVDDDGTVYVSDSVGLSGRVMQFKPQGPGDYENYAYSGRANDIPADGHLAIDAAGNIYIATATEILEFSAGEFGAPSCEFESDSGGPEIRSMTVNPASGEVFYYTEKDTKYIRQLSACNAQGEFEARGKFALTPKPNIISALGFNPTLAWEPSRPPGILYGTDHLGRGYIFAPAEVRFPLIESQSASSVTSTTAALGAQINPKGSITRFAFQYIDQAAYEANDPGERFAGAIEAPPGGAELGAGQAGLSAAASLLGLTPDTTYHYRVIATSHCEPDDPEAGCVDIGDDLSFRTFPVQAPGLADERAWELVSPAQKYGGEPFPLEPDVGSGARCGALGGCKPGFNLPVFPVQGSPDGEALAYEGYPFSPSEGAAVTNQYLSKRTASGWQTTILAPTLMSGAYEAFDAGLSQGILSQLAPSLTPEAPGGYANLYTQPTSSPSTLGTLLSAAPPNRPPGGFSLQYAGASEDLSRVFFRANDALTAETPFAPAALDGGQNKYNLYEWAEGDLRLVNVIPGNAETAPGIEVAFGHVVPFGDDDGPHAISADGSHVFWSDQTGQLYVRIDGESTVEMPDPGHYLTASENGSRVLLSDGHVYALETEVITDLTEGQAGFKGIAGQSDDLSQIYFVDSAVLGGEVENAQGEKAEAGKPNLYAWQGGESTFIATLSDSDAEDWSSNPSHRTAQASPGGRWLAFSSAASLTGYDNLGPVCSRNTYGIYVNAPCREAFLYDSATEELHCASCNPAGVRPLGSTNLPIQKGALRQPRYLTDSGRLYFDTQDALSPFDTNRGFEGLLIDGGKTGLEEILKPSGAGEAGAEDVYQYEPAGVGGCQRELGCVSLISAGRESYDSNFLAIDATGKSVFFTSRDQLSLKDRDELMDIYVAREGGGIAAETETATGECQGEACQPQVSAPNQPSLATSVEGAGNVDEPPPAKCPKGKVRKKGRCAKKHKAKKHQKRHQHRAGPSHRGSK